jgi:hypothetical protein
VVSGRIGRTAALLFAAMAAAAAAQTPAAAAHTPTAGAVTISPLPGTPDAAPHTQISFLGIAAGEIHDVLVRGSRSGLHSGRLATYASGPGASFLPAQPFSEGEQVRVSALVGEASHEQRFSSTFTVARLVHFHFAPMRTPPAAKPGTVQSFASEPGLQPPSVRVTVRAPGSSEDDVFVTANHGYGQWGPMIFSRGGALVWFKPMPCGETATDLQVEQYQGQPVLVWWQGSIASLGVGFGTDRIYSTSYEPVAQIRAGNGYWADLHEAQLTPAGSAFITAYTLVQADLSSVGGARAGPLQDAVLQEIDVKTGLVMFEWHADGHVAFNDSFSKRPSPSSSWPWDFFHLNSISLDASGDGNLLISARNTWAGYEINHATGQVVWRLGGKHSSFHMGSGTGTAWQHDMRWQRDGTITVFDDGAAPRAHAQSRAIHEQIDWQDRRVSLVGRDVRSSSLLTGSQGNDETLPEGNAFVGWGEQPFVTEFDPSGQTVFEANLPYPAQSYRAYTFPWTGTPASPPSLAVSAAGEASTVYASWNGATQVTSWRVLAGPNPAQLTPIATAPASGFQTTIPVASAQADFAVQALGASGQTLATSATVTR